MSKSCRAALFAMLFGVMGTSAERAGAAESPDADEEVDTER